MTPDGGGDFRKTETGQDLFSIKVFLVATGILGAAFLGLTWISRGELGLSDGTAQTPSEEAQLEPAESDASEELASQLSQGEQILLATSALPIKQEGAAAIASGDYGAAVTAFERARRADVSDPETLVYLNNARIGEQEAYGLAIVVPLKSDPTTASSLLRGVAQAQTEINQAGGIQGKSLRIFLADDQEDVAIAQQIATDLSEFPDIVGVLGHNTTETANATSEIYTASALPFVSTSAGASPAIKQLLANDLPIADALAFYMARLNHRTAILFYDGNSDSSLAFKSNFEKALQANQGTMTAEVNLAELSASPPTETPTAEIFVLSPGDSPLKTATESIEIIPNDQVDHFYRHVFGGHELFSPEVLNLFGSMATGTILAVPEALYQSAASPFNEPTQDLWEKSTDWSTSASYNLIQAVITGLKQSPTRQGVQQAIDSNTNDAVRLLRVSINPDTRTGYELLSLGVMTKDGFQPEG
ncbi:ABC transporter substrate-binding protein [Leptothoe sp. EHU-05/26/07-4]